MTGRIELISNIHSSSVPDFLLASWQILLWRLSGMEEIGSECLSEGRQFVDLHSALGLFAGYVLVRGTLRPGLRFDEALKRVKRSLQDATASPEFFLRKMDGRGAMGRSHAIGFEYEEWPAAESAGSVEFRYWKQSVRIDRFKLKLAGYRKADGLTIEIQYDPAIFTRESVEMILERYLKLIQSAVETEQAPIEDLEIVGRRELERLVEDWNRTDEEVDGAQMYPRVDCGAGEVKTGGDSGRLSG